MTHTQTLLQRFSNLQVLVIGDAMLDSYLEGEADRLCREGPVPVVRKRSEMHLPGGAANTAANIRALGARVTFLSLIGLDRAGEYLREALRKRNISDQAVFATPEMSTLHKQRILADGQYVVRVDEGGELTPQKRESDMQRRLIRELERAYQRNDLIVISDYGYGVVSTSLIERLCELQRQQPKIIVVDAKHLERIASLSATVVTPNYQEAVELIGSLDPGQQTQQPGFADVVSLGKRLLARLATEHVAITLGEQGVFLMDRQGQSIHLPAYPVAKANDVGAGDSFASALGLALAAGGSVEEAAQIGIEVACIAVSKPRTALVSLQELKQRIEQREGISQTSARRKQQTLKELSSQLELVRQNGQKIVFTNGVFDLIHFGHIQLLRQARMLGDVLVVGINSDASTRRLKGEGRPINNQHERVALVEALDTVDYVILFDEDTPEALIHALRPDIHVKGGNYANRVLPESAAVHRYGGHVVIIPREQDQSTSRTIARISAMMTHLTPAPDLSRVEQP